MPDCFPKSLPLLPLDLSGSGTVPTVGSPAESLEKKPVPLMKIASPGGRPFGPFWASSALLVFRNCRAQAAQSGSKKNFEILGALFGPRFVRDGGGEGPERKCRRAFGHHHLANSRKKGTGNHSGIVG